MDDLSDVGKDLLSRLKKDENDYHPLERYIYAIDQNLDSSNVLRSIGERIGIFVSEAEDVPEGLYFKLYEYLDRERDAKLTEKIIQMTPDQYEKYLIKLHPSNQKLNRQSFYPLYADRLYTSLSNF